MQLLTKTQHNYLQNNKNFAHSLDIETYKYVAQHDSSEWDEWVSHNSMGGGHSCNSFFVRLGKAAACQ